MGGGGLVVYKWLMYKWFKQGKVRAYTQFTIENTQFVGYDWATPFTSQCLIFKHLCTLKGENIVNPLQLKYYFIILDGLMV